MVKFFFYQDRTSFIETLEKWTSNYKWGNGENTEGGGTEFIICLPFKNNGK